MTTTIGFTEAMWSASNYIDNNRIVSKLIKKDSEYVLTFVDEKSSLKINLDQKDLMCLKTVIEDEVTRWWSNQN